MPGTTIDPRLEGDLAELLRPEPHAPWLVRVGSFIAVPTAIALLALLSAILLATPAGGPVVIAQPDPLPTPTPSTEPTPTPTPTPTPALPASPVPAPTPSATPTTEPVLAPESWIVDAERLATAFALDYLSWPQTPEDQRATVLARYLAPGVDPSVGWRTPGPLVAATPIVMHTQADGPDQVTVTVAVRITGDQTPRWVHLAVPLGRDAEDRAAVIDLPRLVPPAPTGTPTPPDWDDDPVLRAATQDVVLSAVQAHLDPLGVQTGFSTTAIQVTAVARTDARSATARVMVDLTDTITGAELSQALHVEVHRTDLTWSVVRIR